MHVLLFDIDGTLVHTGGAGRAALDTALWDVFEVKNDYEVPVQGRTDCGIAQNLFRAHQIDDTLENRQRFHAGYLDALPHRMREREGRVLPGVERLLERLVGIDDVHLGLLTGNIRGGAVSKLSHFGIYHFFPFGGFGDRHAHRNDVAREAFDDARRHVGSGLDATQVTVIGDTPLDVECARAIGARAIAVATGGASRASLVGAQPDLLLDDLDRDDPWWDR
ncbi:MAG: HAD hydrolase-like protein [Pirellulaceae bacterium]|jgi:phosphoglycolate phosphatase-like HAD superfamily hydrolase|nr:HAD hydrolase-like protein [Pirellulaceae bacterium]MDP7020589.1 HAD hydrolase-like protein [Pirellulaceae bacterium]